MKNRPPAKVLVGNSNITDIKNTLRENLKNAGLDIKTNLENYLIHIRKDLYTTIETCEVDRIYKIQGMLQLIKKMVKDLDLNI